MFDIGFSELIVIAVVALVVLGPERLPRAARFAGLWVRRARAQWYSVKSEFERELAAEDLKRSVEEAKASVREVQTQIQSAAGEVQRQALDVRDEVSARLQPVIESTGEAGGLGAGPDAVALPDVPASGHLAAPAHPREPSP